MTLRPFSSTLQKQFRDTLETAGAPEVIDDSSPVMPVAVVAQVNTATSSGYTRVTDGTDTLAVNTDGSIPVTVPPSGYPLLIAGGTVINTATTTTIATVTAGKTAYIVGWSLYANTGAASGGCKGVFKFDTTVADIIATSSIVGQVANRNFSVPAGTSFALAATKTINVVSTGSGSYEIYAVVYYYEV